MLQTQSKLIRKLCTDVYILKNLKLFWAVWRPICINRITSFLLFIIALFALLIGLFRRFTIFHKGVGSFSILGGGGGDEATKTIFNTVGGGIAKCTYTHACTHTYIYKLLNIHISMYACTYTCMYACICMHAYAHMNLHPDMKIIKIKASELYEKSIYTIYLEFNLK